jgi:putative intracellular protease/amidase
MRTLIGVLAMTIATGIGSTPQAQAAPSKPKRVLMMISEGFFAPEYYEPREIFEKAGFRITVAGKYSGLIAPDRRNTEYNPVKVDTTFDKADIGQFDALVFAGGNGAWEDFFPNEDVHRLLTEAMNKKLLVGLLCSSTGLLGVANNLDGRSKPIAEGRHVTGYQRVEGLLRVLGKVNYDAGEKGKPHVVVDGDLITGRDPIASKLFGETVAKKLKEKL